MARGRSRPARWRRGRWTEARPYAADLGGDGALEEIERILAEGNGAERQRAAFERGGIPAVLDWLAGATAAD